ncbi:MAG: TIM44-like domain-containing protein [bacterium]
MKKKLKCILITLFSIVFFFTIRRSIVFARAGGAGGGGGSGGGGIPIYLLIDLFLILPPAGKFIFLIVLVGGGYVYFFVVPKKSSYSNLPSPETHYRPKKSNSPERLTSSIKELDPEFDLNKFYNKVKVAFLAIQEGWTKQDLSPARKFISDGVYKRFNTQFKMMQLLEQQNVLSDIRLLQAEVVNYNKEKNFDIFQVMIRATMCDSFVSKRLPLPVSNDSVSFVEYWSFIRKRGVKSSKDIYESQACPNCGAILKKMGEIAKCEYCNSIINNAEYDWVLCEITQVTDYVGYNLRAKQDAAAQANIYNLLEHDPNFTIQGLEDKSSNIFMQYHLALVIEKPDYIRPFVSDKVCEKIKKEVKPYIEEHLVYNRIYLADVSTIKAELKNNFVYAHVRCKVCIQKAQNDLQKSHATLKDQFLSSMTIYLILKRKADLKFVLSGGLLSNECPSCGASLGDASDGRCPYCSSIINSGEYDWVLDNYLTWLEYQQLYPTGTAQNIKTTLIPKHKTRELKDYVINNVIMVVMADGKIDPAEKESLVKLSGRYKISKDGINNLIALRKQRKLSLLFPEEREDRERVYKEMMNIASADGVINIDEKLLLTAFTNRTGIK